MMRVWLADEDNGACKWWVAAETEEDVLAVLAEVDAPDDDTEEMKVSVLADDLMLSIRAEDADVEVAPGGTCEETPGGRIMLHATCAQWAASCSQATVLACSEW